MQSRAFLFATFLFIGSAHAQPSDPAPTTPTRGAADGALLEAYVDGVVAAHMRQHRTPGVTVSVVRDGRPLFSKSYGFTDIEKAKPVLGDDTLFRIGSVSKTFI